MAEILTETNYRRHDEDLKEITHDEDLKEITLPWLKFFCSTNARAQAPNALEIEIELLQNHWT